MDEAAIASMKALVAQHAHSDPHIHLKVTAQVLHKIILTPLNSEKGVHVDTALGVFGALAGFAAVHTAWRRVNAGTIAPSAANWTTVDTNDGSRYYFGDAINGPLLMAQSSLGQLVFGKAAALGATMMPDVTEMVRHVMSTVGGPSFGVPRFPPGHNMHGSPQETVRALWPRVLKIMAAFAKSEDEYVLMLTIAILEVMAMARGAIEPDIAAKIVLECAIPMSHVDPARMLAS
jgi:hypothetical protein